MIQAFITALARQTSHCDKHGDVIHVRVCRGATLYGGGYMRTMLYDTTFEDGKVMTFHLVLNVPIVASSWTSRLD